MPIQYYKIYQQSSRHMQTFSLCSEHKDILNMICTEPQCQKKGYNCAMCLQNEAHQGHQLYSLNGTLSSIKKDHQLLRLNLPLCSLIDQTREDIFVIIAELEGILDNGEYLIGMLQKMVLEYIEQYSKIFDQNFLSSLNENSQTKCQFIFNYKQFQEKLKGCLEDDQLEKYKTDIVGLFKQAFVTDITQKKQQFLDQIQICRKSPTSFSEESLLQLFAMGESSPRKYKFSQKHKKDTIKIDEQCKKATQTDMNGDYNGFAVLQPFIKSKKPRSITFKMNRINGWVSVGVAKVQNLIQKNYRFDSYQLGHGAYHCSYDGYLWSDHESSKNSFYSCYYYNQGESMTVELNLGNKKVKFLKNGDAAQSQELDLEFKSNEAFCFCIATNYSQDEVQIVQ